MKKIELNIEQTKEKMKQMKKNENKMDKISKTGIFPKKGFGVNLYTFHAKYQKKSNVPKFAKI